MSGCTDVNTVSSPNPTYFFNTTLAAPFSAGTSTPIWDFTSIWKEHATTYPTFQSFYSAPSSSQNNGTSSGGCGSMFTTVGNTTYITTCGVTSVYSVASTPTPISTPSTASTPASSPTGVSTPPITSPASSAQSSTASTQTSTQTSAPANTTGPVTANGSTGTGYSTASVSSGNELSTAFLSGYVFKRNLKKGMTGDDVQMLQRYLNAHGFLLGTSGPGAPGSETTLFSSRTESAVKRFQAAHAADILSPQSLAAPTGWFYTYTRAYANAHMM